MRRKEPKPTLATFSSEKDTSVDTFVEKFAQSPRIALGQLPKGWVLAKPARISNAGTEEESITVTISRDGEEKTLTARTPEARSRAQGIVPVEHQGSGGTYGLNAPGSSKPSAGGSVKGLEDNK